MAYHPFVNLLHTRTGAGAMRCILYILCLAPVLAHAQQVDSLIQSLADPDAAKRSAAERQLERMGVEARPALISASRGADPAIASAAARILYSLPWHRATDPLQVQLLLANYGSMDEPGRITIVGRLAQVPANLGLPALFRLVQENPSEDVCWSVVTTLTRTADPKQPPPIRTSVVQEQIRHLAPADNRPAALVLGAYGWLGRDRPKAIDMLRRAVEIETRFPTYDNGELDFAFDCLVDSAVVAGRFDEAANLRRSQAARIGVTRDSYPTPIYQLFVLHARHGPLQGLGRDVDAFSRYMSHPQVMYALAEAYEHAGWKLEAMACRQVAHAASLSSESRMAAGTFLTLNGWADGARREYDAICEVDDLSNLRYRFDAEWRLASLAGRDDADAAAIEHFTVLRDIAVQPNIAWSPVVEEMNLEVLFPAEILWRQARIALARGDATEANARFDELLKLNLSETDATDVVQNSYPMLLQLNRREDAQALFEIGHKRLARNMELHPDAPVWWNDLAWLSARCDQDLDKALEMSIRAVAADPDNAAYIDTLAELYFRTGQPAEAVKLETRALQIEPGDIFMTKQLERFKAGIKP